MTNQDDQSPPRNPNFLKLQLERARFERALEIAEGLVEGGKFLNSAELARINKVITGTTGETEPWREGAAACVLPSGRQERLQILSDPVRKARELLHEAQERAQSGDVTDAAAELYAQLVLSHIFKDANRRTAVVAAAYLLRLHGVYVSAMGLHELGLGDLRAEGQMEALRETLRNAVKMSAPRKLK